MFFCCSAKSHKKKDQGQNQKLITNANNIPKNAQLSETVFVAGQGWVLKPKPVPQTDSYKNSPVKKPSQNQTEIEQKESALDMLQELAINERKVDPLLEQKIRNAQNPYSNTNKELWENNTHVQEIHTHKNTLLAGDLAPPQDMEEI